MDKKLLMILAVVVIAALAAVIVFAMAPKAGVTAEGEAWCIPGNAWVWDGPYQDAQVVMKGMELHKGALMCHGQLTRQSAGQAVVVDVWFDETGENVDYAVSGAGGNM